MRGLSFSLLLFLYLASRLTALGALPMFLDERIHLRWAWWIAQGRRLRLPFISGRGLSVWLLAGIVPHVQDPLRAGRLLTVAIGVVTLVAIHRLAFRAAGDARAADLAALFYVACPFTLLYDRMVLTDAYLAAFTALVLLLSIEMARAPRPGTGVGLGLALALGVLAKTTGLLLLAVPLLALVLVGVDRRRALRPLAVAYALAAALFAYPVWLFFRRTEELVGAVGVRENEASFTGNASANLRLAAQWLWTYWTPPLALLAVAGLAFALAHRTRWPFAVLLALVAVGPTLAFVAVSGIWYPRYLLFTSVPLLVLAGWGLVGLLDAVAKGARLGPATGAIVTAAMLVGLLAPALRFDLALWTDPARAPFPALDRFQYVTGWPSGYGLRDSVAFLRLERERRPAGLLVVTPGPSTTAGAVRLLLGADPGVEVRYVDPATGEGPAALARASGRRAVFVVVSLIQGVRLPEGWTRELRPAFASFKPDGAPADAVYRACVDPGCALPPASEAGGR